MTAVNQRVLKAALPVMIVALVLFVVCRNVGRTMRRNFCLLLLLLTALLCSCENSSVSPTSADANVPKSPAKPLPNAKEMINRLITQDGCKDFSAEMLMSATAVDGKGEQVEFRLQRKLSDDGAKTFLTVISPREETDKALLAIEKKDKPTEAYSYLAGLRKLARLDSSRTLGFRGSKVLVQELLGMELGQYSHDSGERVNVEGEPLIKIEFTEKPYMSLAFPRIVGYFHEQTQQPASFELFGRNGELQKKAVIGQVKTIQNHQTITQVTIDDLSQKLNLQLETRKIEYDQNLPEKIFTEENLKRVITEASRRLDTGK